MGSLGTDWCRLNAHERGLTILEILICIVLMVSLIGISLPLGSRTIAYAELWSTTANLINRLRYAQCLAQTTGRYGELRLGLYVPQYQLFSGAQFLGRYTFAPGVTYKDGYLQMTTGSVLYDVYGNAQVAGRIRLTNIAGEQDVMLYMGAGWQTGG